MKGRSIDSISSRETWDLRKTLFKPAVKARVEYDIGSVALHPGSIGTIFRSIIQRSFDLGALPDLTAEDLARLLKGSAPIRPALGSTRICSRAAKIWRGLWMRCGGSPRVCRSRTIAISLPSMGRPGA